MQVAKAGYPFIMFSHGVGVDDVTIRPAQTVFGATVYDDALQTVMEVDNKGMHTVIGYDQSARPFFSHTEGSVVVVPTGFYYRALSDGTRERVGFDDMPNSTIHLTFTGEARYYSTAEDLSTDAWSTGVSGMCVNYDFEQGTQMHVEKGSGLNITLEYSASDSKLNVSGMVYGKTVNETVPFPSGIMYQTCTFVVQDTAVFCAVGGSVVLQVNDIQSEEGAWSVTQSTSSDWIVVGENPVLQHSAYNALGRRIQTQHISSDTPNGSVYPVTRQMLYDGWGKVYAVTKQVPQDSLSEFWGVPKIFC